LAVRTFFYVCSVNLSSRGLTLFGCENLLLCVLGQPLLPWTDAPILSHTVHVDSTISDKEKKNEKEEEEVK
jgi:hypothetical protein